MPSIVNTRNQFLLSFTGIFTLCLSVLYIILIFINQFRLESYSGLSLFYGTVVFVFLLLGLLVNRKGFISLSLAIIVTVLTIVCITSGIRWGFDLPSVLLGYLMCIVLVSLIANKTLSWIYVTVSVISIIFGNYIRNYLDITNTWHGTYFGGDDIAEFAIIFLYITALLIFSNHEQQKLLSRSIRSENILQKERDDLEVTLEKRTLEIKQLQMDQVTHMYRFVEFGKLASGLFHDLISPIQTLKLQIDTKDNPQRQLINIRKTSEKLEHMMNLLRGQMQFNNTIDTFDVLVDIRDLLYITRYLHVKHNIVVDIKCSTSKYMITTNRTILNHVIHNLFSNACEACIQAGRENPTIQIHVGKNYENTYISIIDNGIGIPSKLVERIFEPFYSSKKIDKENSTQNCGLGLSSAKHTVEKYLSGKILCETQENIGTTMTLII